MTPGHSWDSEQSPERETASEPPGGNRAMRPQAEGPGCSVLLSSRVRLLPVRLSPSAPRPRAAVCPFDLTSSVGLTFSLQQPQTLALRGRGVGPQKAWVPVPALSLPSWLTGIPCFPSSCLSFLLCNVGMLTVFNAWAVLETEGLGICKAWTATFGITAYSFNNQKPQFPFQVPHGAICRRDIHSHKIIATCSYVSSTNRW